MISNHDRSDWFGASDTDYIVGNWNTKSFFKWWNGKLGFDTYHFKSLSTNAGTNKEHQILEYLNIPCFDKQIKIPSIKLRVNLDGNSLDTIYEVKTHSAEKPFKCPLKYKRQVWVQMYASGIRKAYIAAYGLKEKDYKNYFLPIDKNRLQLIPIEYNEEFIEKKFLPKVKYLANCLRKGCLP